MAAFYEEDGYDYEENNEPDSKMMDYHPYAKGQNLKHSPGSNSQTLSYLKQDYNIQEKEMFYRKVHRWLKKELEKSGPEVVLALVPGHKENPNPNGLVHKIVQNFQDKCMVTGTSLPFLHKMLLVRTRTVPKSATSEGPRSKHTHRGTIKVDPNFQEDCSGKVVVILDDIWTSGSTLMVCEEVVRDEFPRVKDVKLIAIGRTISM